MRIINPHHLPRKVLLPIGRIVPLLQQWASISRGYSLRSMRVNSSTNALTFAGR